MQRFSVSELFPSSSIVLKSKFISNHQAIVNRLFINFRYTGRLSILNDGAVDSAQSLTVALKDLYEAMDKSAKIAPLILLQVLHMTFPRFAEKGEGGGFCQQDANECWTELIRMLQQKLKTADSKNFIDQYFSGTFDVEMRCSECPEESPVYSSENFLQLSCFITTGMEFKDQN